MKKTLLLMNTQTNQPVAEHLIRATSPLSRAIGLLGKKSMDTNSGIYFPKCRSIHTHFMQFPIDILFVDDTLTVTDVFPKTNPWKFVFAKSKTSKHAIELASGRAEQTAVSKGTKLCITEPMN